MANLDSNRISGTIRWMVGNLSTNLSFLDGTLDRGFVIGPEPSITDAYISLFNLQDAHSVLTLCNYNEPNFVQSFERQIRLFGDRLKRLEHTFSKSKNIDHLVQESLEKRVADYHYYVDALPKNVSPDGDGFGNILSKRQSIEGLLYWYYTKSGSKFNELELLDFDSLLVENADPNWYWVLSESSCQHQLKELHPIERWWWYGPRFRPPITN